MLRAVGFTEEDFAKPQVAVASSWNEVTPCNYHLDKLAALSKEGVRQGDAVPVEFTTIAVTDGIAMGHEGMKASLMSRDLIADSVELVMHAERMDALVGIAGCDKSEPGMLMAMARLNLPSVYLYGGTILPGTYRGARRHDPGRVRGGRGARQGHDRRRGAARHRARGLPDDRLVRRHVHGEHDGGGGEAIGMSLPGSASPARGRLPPRGGRARVRHRGCEAPRGGDPAPRRHDEGRLRERDRRRDGARRLDERRAAPARDRARGPRRPGARRLRPDQPGRCRTSSTSARPASS